MFELRDNDIFDPSWFRKNSGEPNPNRKLFVTSEQVKDLVDESLSNLKAESFQLTINDEVYFLPPVHETQEIIDRTRVEYANKYGSKTSDRDMVHFMKTNFLNDAYQNGRRRAPHCTGIASIEGNQNQLVFWVINNDLNMRVLELTNDTLLVVHHFDFPIKWMTT